MNEDGALGPSSNLPVTARCKRGQGRTATVLALVLLSAAAHASTAQGSDAGSNRQTTQTSATSSSTSSEGLKLPGVTIEAARRRERLRLKANEFVTSVVVQSPANSLYRWTQRICPRVEGLPENLGEFILERISKAAADADAPLAGRKCRPNLYVIASNDPDETLDDWRARDQNAFSEESGGTERLGGFLHSNLPIRAWYNTYSGCSDDVAAGPGATMELGGINMGGGVSAGCADYQATRIGRGTGADIAQAIVVIDLRQMRNVTHEQMGDYVALVSLADVRLDSDPTVPSILELFDRGVPPQGMTPWDRAFLRSLYDTDHMSTTEVKEVEIGIVNRIVGSSQAGP